MRYGMKIMMLAAMSAVGYGQAGSMSGSVVRQNGTPVNGGFVIATRTGGGAAGRFTARSVRDGSFRFASLPVGTYRVCAQTVGMGLLDSCKWSAPVSVAVASGQSPATTIRLQQGATLSVRVQDDNGALAANQGKGKTAGAHVLVGVWAGGVFHPMRLRDRRGANWNHDLLVPYDVALNVTAASRAFELTDDKGAAMAAAGVPVRVVAGSRAEAIVVKVKGLRNGK